MPLVNSCNLARLASDQNELWTVFVYALIGPEGDSPRFLMMSAHEGKRVEKFHVWVCFGPTML